MPGVLASRLPGDLQHICSEKDLQPIDLPSLAEYVLTPPAPRHFWFFFAGYSVVSIGQNVKRRGYLRVDDPIGAVPVHLAAGIWGTLSLGLFASGAYGLPTPTSADTSSVVSGLFYGGGASQFLKQLL